MFYLQGHNKCMNNYVVYTDADTVHTHVTDKLGGKQRGGVRAEVRTEVRLH